jgi:hypothetical protein
LTDTQLHVKPTICIFDPKYIDKYPQKYYEFIDSSHPLIMWICDQYKKNVTLPLHPVSTTEISLHELILENGERSIKHLNTGLYLYVIYSREFRGLTQIADLYYQAVNVETEIQLSSENSEILINHAIFNGKDLSDSTARLDMEKILKNHEICLKLAQEKYKNTLKEFDKNNMHMAIEYIHAISDFVVKKNQEQRKAKETNKLNEIKDGIGSADQIQSKAERTNENCSVYLKRICDNIESGSGYHELATGLIFIKE